MKKSILILLMVVFVSIIALDVFACNDCRNPANQETHFCMVCQGTVATVNVFNSGSIIFTPTAFAYTHALKTVLEPAVSIEKPPQNLV